MLFEKKSTKTKLWILLVILGLVYSQYNNTRMKQKYSNELSNAPLSNPTKTYPKHIEAEESEQSGIQSITAGIKKSLEHITYNAIEEQMRKQGFVSQIRKSVSDIAELNIITLKEGEGEPARCGQKVRVKLLGYTEEPLHFFDRSDDIISLIPGENKISRGLNLGIIGMKTGELRRIVIPRHMGLNPEYAAIFNPPKADIVYEVNLISIDDITPNLNQIKIFDNKASIFYEAACGDNVTVSITIESALNGNILYQTPKPRNITLGLNDMAVGIDEAGIGMASKWNRTALMPASLVKPLLSAHTSINDQERVLVHIDMLEAQRYKAPPVNDKDH